MPTDPKKTDTTPAQAGAQQTVSEKFLAKVEQQFSAELGGALQWTPLQRTLAQHLYVRLTQVIPELNKKRAANDLITWDKINMPKLALDAVHRVAMGLDALIPNHLHMIPYKSGATGLFDFDLRIGYTGKLYTRLTLSLDPPKEIIIRLVRSNEKFVPHFKDMRNEIESYELSPGDNPFDPGEVIGGFGYVVYEDPAKNRLFMVTQKDFDRAQKSAQTQDFWGKDKSPDEMKYKTVAHRVCDKIALDPAKVNAITLAATIEAEMDAADLAVAEQAALNANKEVLEIPAEVPKTEAASIPVAQGVKSEGWPDAEPIPLNEQGHIVDDQPDLGSEEGF